jgi:hypothetical protein
MSRTTHDRRHEVAALMVAIGLLASAGCDRGGPQIAPVTGKVTLDGQPLAAAKIEFQPDSGAPSYGRTGEDGGYALLFVGQQHGALIGHHTVRIRTAELDSLGDHMTRESVPAKYNSRSTLTAEVSSGSNVHNFDLTSR